MTLSVTLIAQTEINDRIFEVCDVSDDPDVSTQGSDGEYLIETAGRGCYQSWDRPNPETAATRDYIRKNIIGKGHESVLEHVSTTFYVTGVSRSLTHELIRHRHLSFSELSQRYVDMETARFVMPPLIREGLQINEPGSSPEAKDAHWQAMFDDVRVDYQGGVAELTSMGFPRKQSREAARAVLPNATETKFTVTGNLRTWRHVLRLRGSLHADAEIREFAIEVFRQLEKEYPSVFADMTIKTDGPSGRQYIGEQSLEPAQLDGMAPVRGWPVKQLGVVGTTND